MSYAQKLYWASPYWLKVALAWFHTSRLTAQRYGEVHEQIFREIKQRNSWTAEQWCNYQNEILRRMVRHACEHVPYYRNLLQNEGIDPEDIRSIKDIGKLPILDKQTVRNSPESFVDERKNIDHLIKGHTSGTTGTPLLLHRTVQEASTATAFFDARCHEVVGMSRVKNRSVSIGGHLVASHDRKKPPFWIYNPRWNQLYMSSYHLSQNYLGYYVEKLRSFLPEYIEGYPSSVYAIAQYIEENRLEPIPCKACFTTAETLYGYHREAIERAFCCATYNQYGCGEMAVFAAECPQGAMHISPDYCVVEVVDDNDIPLPDGQQGHLICTSLVNWSQPFIRYRVGDIGMVGTSTCACGSSMPILESIEGRSESVLVTRDRRKIGRLDPVFKGVRGVCEAQIIQNDYDRFVIRVVPAREFCEEYAKVMAGNLADRVGQSDIRVEIVDAIGRTSNGKFQAVINNMQCDESG